MARILIVEDEIKIARFVELELKHEGYEVKAVHDGNLGFEEITKSEYDLAVLDVMLPGMSGFDICGKAREAGVTIPIIMLTAKDDVSDKLSGFGKGADDYMTKPFAIEELLARIKVHLARVATGEVSKSKSLEFGQLKLNLASHTAYYGEDELALTKKEYELLEYLLKNMGAICENKEYSEKITLTICIKTTDAQTLLQNIRNDFANIVTMELKGQVYRKI